jgi:hypothetical protein
MRTRLLSYLRTHWRESAGWVLVWLGGVFVLLGWVGVSGKDIAPLQLPYLASGGIGGIVVAAVGLTLLLSADLRRDRERLTRIEGELLELQDLVRELVTDKKKPRNRGVA